MKNAEFMITGSVIALNEPEKLPGDNIMYSHGICIGGEKNSIYWVQKFSPESTIQLSKGDTVFIRGELRGKVKKEEPSVGNKYYGYKLVAKKIIKEPVPADPTGIEV